MRIDPQQLLSRVENENIIVKQGTYNAPKGTTTTTTWAKDIPPFRQRATISKPIPPRNRLTEAYTSKHRLPEDNGSRPASISDRPKKRLKPRLIARQTIDSQTARSGSIARTASPHSPLFFSHTPRQGPLLPPGLSSSSAAEMLNKGREETGGVTTLKLARGSVSTASPPRSITGTSIARSPETKGRSVGMQILGSVGITELLEQDERPTFIIDVANPINFTPGGPLVIVYANASLRGYGTILDMVTSGEKTDSPGIVTDFPEFKAWALSFVKHNESMDVCLPSISYGGINWSCCTLRKRLRLISGSGSAIASAGGSTSSTAAPLDSPMLSDTNKGFVISQSPLAQSVENSDYFGDIPPSPILDTLPQQNASSPMSLARPPRQAMIAAQSDALTSDMLISRYPDNPSFDWTRLPLSAALPKHIQFARSIDWASTPLGPIENWAFDLRAMCNLIMGSPHPAAMYWGDEYIAIYNEAYIMLAGKKHPELMVSPQVFNAL